MAMAFSTLLVIANDEQIPNTAIAIWFSVQKPFFKTLKDFV
jgi:hypothetical protein